MKAPLIGRFEHLKNRPRSAEAGPLLEKIASQVKPIMAKRGWKVGTLAEFLPANPALLGNNMNHGQRINLRLRPADNPNTFYEYEQLVLVMLHELTHIVHGPHDASFYKLLGELEEEYYDLKRKGYEGEGFHSAGNRLNGMRVNEYEGRRKGLAAAEKRLAQQKAMGRGGVLGGSSRTAGKTMREIVAEAAERRIKDDKTCNTATPAEVEEEIRKAQAESVGVDAVDITHSDDEAPTASSPPSDSPASTLRSSPTSGPSSTGPSSTGPSSTGPSSIVPDSHSGTSTPDAKKRPVSSPEVIDLTGDSPPRPARPLKQAAREAPNVNSPRTSTAASSTLNPAPKEWSCPTCTLLNPLSAARCDACASPRPALPPSADGWFCDFCGAGPREMGFWSCVECGWVRKWG